MKIKCLNSTGLNFFFFMVLVGICGPKYSGRHTVQDLLVSLLDFKILKIADFTSASNLLESISDNIWKANLVVILSCFKDIEILSKRPFFICLHVDADPLIRYSRQSDLQLLDFLKSDSYNENKLYAAKANVNINNFSSLSGLADSLINLNILNENRFRPSWDLYFTKLAIWTSQRSNCMKRRVGCVLVNNSQIVSTGYNGTPRGVTNCYQGGCVRCNTGARVGVNLDECLCLHAEENALLEAGRERAQGGTLFCTTCPCLGCAKKIAQCGIKRVVYIEKYDSGILTRELFKMAGIELEHYEI